MPSHPLPLNTVLTLDQAYAHLSPSSVRRRLKSGLWQSPLPGVVVTGSGELTSRQRRTAALAWAGPAAALTGRTSAALDGLKGYDDDKVYVIVDIDSGLRSRSFVTVHRTLWLDERHVHPTRRPRRARIERAIVDIATDARSWQSAVAVMAAAVQQGLTRVADLRGMLENYYPRACWRRELLAVLADLEGGSHSLPEVQAIRAIRAHGLPEPDRQSVRKDNGRNRYLDLFWTLYQLCIEIDGALHMTVEQWWADMLRDAEITIGGPTIVRVPAFVVRETPDAFADLTGRLLVSRGWSPDNTLALK